mmetsp:Transcript_9898/g.26903  ORF Transcript_9898/g.26903 Transcript_9898/m.26903 type:complete len:107 (-) Transcript_9898:337-657(-)|eukprot:CAMPEP_0202400966 /NCGR_PEP_ID=MMETSP1128-20130828/3138_1 /ASSEMBLY_ACC=CAM_ASM_000463 /TAXON_ID=3047 /ORGANISM="Dunaliella tertiolecta, Strain CCMP1320" /LENGTH=106 /DNA_ID=CAMNT_0049004669 /DNA_START=679 /DNA_END=999 /DNA_ORIENTATION=-
MVDQNAKLHPLLSTSRSGRKPLGTKLKSEKMLQVLSKHKPRLETKGNEGTRIQEAHMIKDDEIQGGRVIRQSSLHFSRSSLKTLGEMGDEPQEATGFAPHVPNLTA